MTPTKETLTEEKNAEAAKSLGISSAIYGLGYTVKDAFISFAIATSVAFGVIFLGSRPGNFIDRSTTSFYNGYKKVEEYLSSRMNGMKSTGSKLGTAASIAIAFGWVVSHIVQIPSYFNGTSKVDKAIETHAHLIDENKILLEDVKTLRERLAALEKNPKVKELAQSRAASSSSPQPPAH